MILFNDIEVTASKSKNKSRIRPTNSILKNEKLFISTTNFFQSKKTFRKYISYLKTEVDNLKQIKKDRSKSAIQNYLSPALKIKQINNIRKMNEDYFTSTKYSKKTLPLTQQQNNTLFETVKEEIQQKIDKQKNCNKLRNYCNLDNTHQNKLQLSKKLSQFTIFTTDIQYISSNKQKINYFKPTINGTLRYLSQQKLQINNDQKQQGQQLINKNKFEQIKNEFKFNKKRQQVNKIRQKLARHVKKKTSLNYSKKYSFRENPQKKKQVQKIQLQTVNKDKFKNYDLFKNQKHSENCKIIKKKFIHQLSIQGSICHKL